MKIPLDDSLNEHDFDDEFDALPSTGDPADDLSRARRRRTASRRRRVLAAAVVGVALAVIGVAGWPSPTAQLAVPAGPPSSGPATPGANGQATASPEGSGPGSCAGTVRLVASNGTEVTLTQTSTPTLEVEIGDMVRLTSDGPCSAALILSVRSDAKLSPRGDQVVEAVKTGSTRVDVAHPGCALVPPQRGCIGGIAPDGQAMVVIRDHTTDLPQAGPTTPAKPAMTIDPSTAPPGSLVTLHFPSSIRRGMYFSLESRQATGWRLDYYLVATTEKNPKELSWYRADDPNLVFFDVGVSGPGGERVRVPDVAVPGDYRLCTAQSKQTACSDFKIN